MTSRRYSLGLALASIRGALSTTARAEIRYAKHGIASTRIALAMKKLQDAEAELRAAVRSVAK